MTAVLTRTKQGNLQGGVHLVSENGWKIDALDTSLLGINLGALQTLGAYCAALETQNYTTAYGFLGSTLTSQAPQALFTAAEQLQDQVDGKVTGCAISAISASNTDTSTTVTASITRSTLGARSGNITLDGTGGTWKISKVDDALQGSDLAPLVTVVLFCAALQANDFATAYSLLSAAQQALGTEAEFAASLTLPSGAKWGGCTPDFSTYKVSGTTAQITGAIAVLSASGTNLGSVTTKFLLVLEGGAWKIDDLQVAD